MQKEKKTVEDIKLRATQLDLVAKIIALITVVIGLILVIIKAQA